MQRKRGRPKLLKLKRDFGTPELIAKRALRSTKEPLDLCLEKSLIHKEQHKVGLYFRWLYTLKHGVPWVRSKEFFSMSRGNTKHDLNEDWLARRQQVYQSCVPG